MLLTSLFLSSPPPKDFRDAFCIAGGVFGCPWLVNRFRHPDSSSRGVCLQAGSDLYAFVEFAVHRDAQLALTAMNKRVVLGRVCCFYYVIINRINRTVQLKCNCSMPCAVV